MVNFSLWLRITCAVFTTIFTTGDMLDGVEGRRGGGWRAPGVTLQSPAPLTDLC